MIVSNKPVNFEFDLRDATQPILAVCADENMWPEIVLKAAESLRVGKADMIYFDPAEGIADLRSKINNLNIKPHSADYRLFVVYSANILGLEQANTLLKTLEEMPSYSRMILLSKSLTRILPTIKSRCHKVIWADDSDKSDKKEKQAVFLDYDFNKLIEYINSVENDQIPDILEDTLKSLRGNLVDKNTVEIYKKIANAYIKSKNTNVNRKLLIEEIYIFKRAMEEK